MRLLVPPGGAQHAPLPEGFDSEHGQRVERALLALEVEAEVAARAAELGADDDGPRVPWIAESAGGRVMPREESIVEASSSSKREPRLLEWNGEQRTAFAWSRDPRVIPLGMTGQAIANRVDRGWTAEEALTYPKGQVPERLGRLRQVPCGPPPGRPRRPAAQAPAEAPPAPPVVHRDVKPANVSQSVAQGPAELLERAGWTVEVIGQAPRGVVLLVVEAGETPTALEAVALLRATGVEAVVLANAPRGRVVLVEQASARAA